MPKPVLSNVVCSAPGKVLLAGGYLVLDRAYTGLVLGLDARIHVLAQPSAASDSGPSEIVVRSPQFKDAIWRYHFENLEKDGGIRLSQIKASSTSPPENRFVQTALTYALTWACSRAGAEIQPMEFTILADSDYYSNEAKSFDFDDRFQNFDVPLHEAHKTGLGSSAALVTAIVNAAVLFYSKETTQEQDQWMFRLAQAAHCAAQGKIGSGFDVAAASQGSCIYRRFSPEILSSLGSANQAGFQERLRAVIEGKRSYGIELNAAWDYECGEAFSRFPVGLRVVMCDIDCGSETVGMVSKVLQWKKEKPEEASLLWATLQVANEDLANQLRKCIHTITCFDGVYDDVRSTLLTIRSLVREMSMKAAVPIEPPVQSALIDACSELPGVIGGVVPGAGGYDAIALLVRNDTGTIHRLGSFLSMYKSEADNGDTVSIARVRVLKSKQVDKGGWQVENCDNYRSWLRCA
ncbi:uncharacterized protein KY384_007623 [Bacidia gigantensis]|uniref:uncharacterized protein n=1 Tax=Bacidia gigantensis TaxID=2732470 RepID=UPI001D0561A7|nr:uncharacterized protein KY384_007623 [Bacidia gigantensis]KAG8527471.1 hypothetical protein KY384_007623 [Bacidia gigantensis]